MRQMIQMIERMDNITKFRYDTFLDFFTNCPRKV